MATSPVISPPSNLLRRLSLPTLMAFFAVYVFWGSTYFAIRVAVATVPPLLAAGLRFFIAGLALYLYSRLRGIPSPSRAEWKNLWILGTLMFLIAYSCLFWAEKIVPSGVASMLVATIPIWTAFFEIFIAKRERFRWSLLVAVLLGLTGIVVLARNPAGGAINILGCLAVLCSSLSWSIGTVWSKSMIVPESKLISAGCQMMTGGAMLLVCSALFGEMHPFPHISLNAAGAILYLIVFGSLLAFTAFVWLLSHMPSTKVASYAYVNPVVALAIGYWLGDEPIGIRTFVGAGLVLGSVLLILSTKDASVKPS